MELGPGRRSAPWTTGLGPTLAPVLLVLVCGMASYTVVRFRVWIVLAYLAAVVLLAVHTWRSARVGPSAGARPRTARAEPAGSVSPAGPVGLAVATALAGVLVWTVPAFTYLDPGPARGVRALIAVTALACAALLLLPWTPGGDLALAVALAGYLVSSCLLISRDPAPSIDVWYTLQGAADSLAAGHDIYRETWLGPPGVMGAFTYLPWTALLVAPGRWLFGDVRYALVALTVVAALILRLMPALPFRTTRRASVRTAAGVAVLLLLLPGTSTQVEQAWTEPMLLAALAGACWALTREKYRTAVLLLALGMACKQHLALLLPLLAAWPRFGVRRAVATALTAGVLVGPWLLADARAFLDDTVFLLIRYQPLRFADTLYSLAINQWNWTPPFWLTATVVLGTLAAVTLAVRRTDPDPARWLLWGAVLLGAANLVNKQAFYNQFWLVITMVLAAWAVHTATSAEPTASRAEPQP